MAISNQADVVIVGAGPAGCAASYDLANAGLSVLLLDKAEFPRVKPCAGGVTIKAIKALRYRITPVIRQTCRAFVVGLGVEHSTMLPSKFPICAMTVRSEFDAFCLKQCTDKGVYFRTIPQIDKIERSGDKWVLETDDGIFESLYLVGADGANSRIRQLLGLGSHIQFGVAVEACVPWDKTTDRGLDVDFGYVQNGYAWVFPKGDHLNVGVFSLDKMHDPKAVLHKYCQAKLHVSIEDKIIGHRIPHHGHLFRHRAGDPFLVGDAAGLIDPLLGEGIYNAIRSGQIAASVIQDMSRGKRDTYARRIKEVTADLKNYWPDTTFFYGDVRRGYRRMTAPPLRDWLINGYALGLPIREMKRKALWLRYMRPKHYLLEPPLDKRASTSRTVQRTPNGRSSICN